ncbi:MAG TPA: hypothetical protein VEI97_05045 [bacterium]|nr:hypothetical protein [bacterium]
MRFTFVDRETGLLKPVMNPDLCNTPSEETTRVIDPNDFRIDYRTEPEPRPSIADLLNNDPKVSVRRY